MAKKKRRPPKAECVYCGKHGLRDWDHVPPQNLFPKHTEGLIKVPSCLKCNSGASKDDEYFRQVLVLRHDISEDPAAKELYPKVLRSLRHPKKKGMLRSLLRTMTPVEMVSPAGLYLGRTGRFEMDPYRLTRVAERIARGLLWHHHKVRLPDSHKVQAFLWDAVPEANRENLKPTLAIFGSVPDRKIGDGSVFRYRYLIDQDEDACASVWLLIFFGRVGFVAWIGRKPEAAGSAGVEGSP